MFKNKKLLWTALVVAVVLAVGVSTVSSAQATRPAQLVETGKVQVVNRAEGVSTSGELQAQSYTRLTWKTSGTVEKVHVQAGAAVRDGDILLSLKTLSAPASIISAQADLVTARQALEDILKSRQDLARAEQSVADAMQAVEDAQEDVTKLEYRRASDDLIDQTEDEIDLAEQKVSRAEDNYKRFKKRPDGDTLKAQAELTLIEARRERDDKISMLNWYLGKPDDIEAAQYAAALALAEAQLEDARREVARLKDGPDPDDVAAAQARVDAALATVNSLYIIAPFDGQVLSVEQVAGDSVSAGELSLLMADMDHLYVEAQVDESDVALVQVGQDAVVTLDALSGSDFKGRVASINPVGETISGLVKYRVRIDLEPVSGQSFIPLGATANVTIHVQDAAPSLAVPITTIYNDTQGEYVLIANLDGSTRRVSVVTGAIMDDLVIVAGDLQEGQPLAINQAAGFEAPNPFGGGQK